VPLYDFVIHRTQLLRSYDKYETGDRLLAASNGQEQSEQQLIPPCDANVQKQQMFWVASAPLSIQGHINVSPKGTADSFHLVNSKQVWYQDISGSGIETISHIRENGRITIMFSAFEGPPRILRLYGVGTVHEYGTPEYNALISAETRKPGSRAAIIVDVYQVGTSCGYAVPLYDFVIHRTQLLRSHDKYETGDRLLAASNGQEQSEQQLLPPATPTSRKRMAPLHFVPSVDTGS